MTNPEWAKYYLGFAHHAATKSKDTTKVGAALIGPNGEVRLTGYNGIPHGVEDAPERLQRPDKYLYVNHAEANIVAFAARNGIATDGCCLVTSHFPCSSCARLIIQAGIKHVLVGDGKTNMPDIEFEVSETMFEEAEVFVERV